MATSTQFTSFNHNGIAVQYLGRKWQFTMPNNNSLILGGVGGQENAKRVAGAISGAFKRNGALDGLARGIIRKITVHA